MTSEHADPFRPIGQPEQRIYDRLIAEQALRGKREADAWLEAELRAMWEVARDCCLESGKKPLEMAQVRKAEMSACGHSDYAAQWAYGLSEAIYKQPRLMIAT
ncbi:hypothetical protein CCO03_08535 [Comamonas serinivorans]|uniref:Uncharacterized protein n=1 Tax=Comamonas serinivorans TaxID=1082851 RepID=A0A1Y0EM41_9BURK|nr:hypothetical protein CCO03_08535 [Comamonas serinivorans]